MKTSLLKTYLIESTDSFDSIVKKIRDKNYRAFYYSYRHSRFKKIRERKKFKPRKFILYKFLNCYIIETDKGKYVFHTPKRLLMEEYAEMIKNHKTDDMVVAAFKILKNF